ncbi:reverse transcriptase [Gossypium australe]|uniref:Reverse transcriptase n=1 Tax=Gossypium australe TaxID=47621 RepID=A0A5B6UQ82_9ROSI|nr:reverse transcriptase [Gossypium australe]
MSKGKSEMTNDYTSTFCRRLYTIRGSNKKGSDDIKRNSKVIRRLFRSNTSEGNKEEISTILGVRPSTNMEKYLGLPNVVGRRKKESFQNLKENVNFIIKGWSNRFLSQGGKEVFIKSILQAIPTYAMSSFLLPNSFCGELEKIIANFWWQKAHGNKGIHWGQWQHLCRSKNEGGMGFRNMAKFNVSLLAKQVAKLIDDNSRNWKEELIGSTFPEDVAAKISRVPLAKEPHDDILAWSGESSGEFTYGKEVETMNHLFRECPVSISVWEELSFSDFLKVSHMEFIQWLTWVFEQTTWAIFLKRIHEKANRSGKETTNFINSYILELNGIEEEIPKVLLKVKRWKHPLGQFVKINFNIAYDENLCQLAVGIVARDSKGTILLSYSALQQHVVSAFAAEAIAYSTTTRIGVDMKWQKNHH